MKTYLHIPLTVELEPHVHNRDTNPEVVPDMYTLLLTFKEGCPVMRLRMVYVPRNVAFALQSGDLEMYQIVRLESEDAALSHDLGKDADYVVLGVVTKTGNCIYEYPTAWQNRQQGGWRVGVTLLAIAAGLLVLDVNAAVNLAAAVLFATGYTAWRYARHIGVAPFSGEVWSKPGGFEAIEWRPPPVWVSPI